MSEEAGIEYLPDTLRALLEELFAGKKAGIKVASIGQAMMQATRPQILLAPLQFGLGVQLYHHFASQFLIDSLHGSFWPQLLHQIRHAVFAADVEPPNSTS